MTKLVEMRVDELMERWRPGSQDETWTWSDEYTYCWTDDRFRTVSLMDRVEEQGIGFDDAEHPVILGNDGRVWDGHHRILIAREFGIKSIKVEIVPQYYSRYEAQYQEAEKNRHRQISRNDWLTPIDLIIWEHTWFLNDIVFNGDDKPIKESNGSGNASEATQLWVFVSH